MKIIGMLLLAVMFIVSPAIAQRGPRGGGQRGGGQQHGQGNRSYGNRGNERRDVRGYSGYGRDRELERGHYDGRRFDGDYRGRYFGSYHRFIISPVMRYGGGFYYGGFQFAFIGGWPLGWAYEDGVYIDEYDGGYFLYNSLYPGVRVGLTVVF